MINKHFAYKILPVMAACLMSSISASQAEPAKLTDDLKLHVPVIHFQGQYLWADLDYFSGSDGSLNFKVKNMIFWPKKISNLPSLT